MNPYFFTFRSNSPTLFAFTIILNCFILRKIKAIKKYRPELEDLLDCLASDASGIENSPDFEDWCGEYGYDTDSRKAEKIFKTVEHQARRLKQFLGDDLYEALLWNTERC